MTHDVDTVLHREGAYDHGYYAVCTCGWTGPLHPLNRRGQALIDGWRHQRDTRGTAA